MKLMEITPKKLWLGALGLVVVVKVFPQVYQALAALQPSIGQ